MLHPLQRRKLVRRKRRRRRRRKGCRKRVERRKANWVPARSQGAGDRHLQKPSALWK